MRCGRNKLKINLYLLVQTDLWGSSWGRRVSMIFREEVISPMCLRMAFGFKQGLQGPPLIRQEGRACRKDGWHDVWCRDQLMTTLGGICLATSLSMGSANLLRSTYVFA